MGKCGHKVRGKLIEIPGKDGKTFGTRSYEIDYHKLEVIAHKLATGEGPSYYYMEFLYCCECHKILEVNSVFTD